MVTHEEWLKAVDAGCAWAEAFGRGGLRLEAVRWVYSTQVVSVVVRMAVALVETAEAMDHG